MLPTAMTEGYTQSALHVIQCFALYAKPGYALYRDPLSIVSSPSPGYCLLCPLVVLELSGVNQTVNPRHYPLNWGIMPAMSNFR